MQTQGFQKCRVTRERLPGQRWRIFGAYLISFEVFAFPRERGTSRTCPSVSRGYAGDWVGSNHKNAERGVNNIWGESYEWLDLPQWRKAVIVFLFAFLFAPGFFLFSKETDIYASAPGTPVRETGRLIAVHVNHGCVRYVTEAEATELRQLRAISPAIVGLTMLGMLALATTHRVSRNKVANRL